MIFPDVSQSLPPLTTNPQLTAPPGPVLPQSSAPTISRAGALVVWDTAGSPLGGVVP